MMRELHRVDVAARRPIRVLSVIDDLGFGGDENRLLSFATAVDRERFEHRVLTIQPPDSARPESWAMYQQYLAAGLVDEMEINLAPVLLGRGERLFAGVDDLKGLQLQRTIATPKVVHLKFARV